MKNVFVSGFMALALFAPIFAAPANAAVYTAVTPGLIAHQPDSPISIEKCRGYLLDVAGESFAGIEYRATDKPVKSVTFRLAYLGMDQRVLGARSYAVPGKFSPGALIVDPVRYLVGPAYDEGTMLCGVTSVIYADGSTWDSHGSDKPWNPLVEIMWGDEPL